MKEITYHKRKHKAPVVVSEEDKEFKIIVFNKLSDLHRNQVRDKAR